MVLNCRYTPDSLTPCNGTAPALCDISEPLLSIHKAADSERCKITSNTESPMVSQTELTLKNSILSLLVTAKTGSYFLTILVIILCSYTVPYAEAEPSFSSQIQQLQKNINKAGEDISRASHSGTQDDFDDLSDRLDKLTNKVTDLQAKIRKARNTSNQTADDAQSLYWDIQDLREKLRDLTAKGPTEHCKSLVKDPGDFPSMPKAKNIHHLEKFYKRQVQYKLTPYYIIRHGTLLERQKTKLFTITKTWKGKKTITPEGKCNTLESTPTYVQKTDVILFKERYNIDFTVHKVADVEGFVMGILKLTSFGVGKLGLTLAGIADDVAQSDYGKAGNAVISFAGKKVRGKVISKAAGKSIDTSAWLLGLMKDEVKKSEIASPTRRIKVENHKGTFTKNGYIHIHGEVTVYTKTCEIAHDPVVTYKRTIVIGDCPDEAIPPITVDSGQWCSYWPWELPGGVFTPGGTPPGNPFTPGGWVPPPNHLPPGIFIPDGNPFIPEHVNTPEHKKHPRHTPEHKPKQPPTTYVKVKQSVIENGKMHSKPVAGAQFKLSSLAPDLPVAGNKKNDAGFDQDPVQGVSDKNGDIILDGKGSDKISRSESPSVASLFDTIGGIDEAVAAPRRRTARNTLQVTIPSIKSYIIRIKINRNKRNWKNPSSHLNKKAAKYVVRSWIAGNILYAVVAVPRHAGDIQ